MELPVTLDRIEKAAEIAGGMAIRTPLVYSPSLSAMFGGGIYLKLENLQKTGSFKLRGAVHKLARLSKKRRVSEVVAASAGNHAQGVALAATNLGIRSSVVMPQWASISKQEATRAYGGRVVCFGQSISECIEKAMEIADDPELFVHPFDDPDIIAGQGTVGLEIMEDLEDLDLVVCPVGGGGLISGIACAVKTINPEVRVVGVQAKACPSALAAMEKGGPVQVESSTSIADGISVKQAGEITFGIMKRFVDDVVLVEEEEIAAAILTLLEKKKILAEGAGAVGLAALANGSVRVPPGGKAVVVVSGGNVDSPLLGRILRQGLVKSGRVMRFEVDLEDFPGALARLLDLVASSRANVLHIYHDRHLRSLGIYKTRVELEIETRGPEHIGRIARSLAEAGYSIGLK